MRYEDLGPGFGHSNLLLILVDRSNPLDEKTVEENEVEVFEPKTEWDLDQQIGNQLAKMIVDEENLAEESRQTHPKLINIEPIFREGPRLPETGLRSRDLCYSHSENM